jgi:hypothetical protein
VKLVDLRFAKERSTELAKILEGYIETSGGMKPYEMGALDPGEAAEASTPFRDVGCHVQSRRPGGSWAEFSSLGLLVSSLSRLNVTRILHHSITLWFR